MGGGCPAQQCLEQEGALEQGTPKLTLRGWARSPEVSDIQQTERARETLAVVYLQCN